MNSPARKLEFLALKWAVNGKFHHYLYGDHCDVKMDNNPLTNAWTSAKLDAAGYRWLASLSMYDLSITYCSGKTNADADALSKLHEGDNYFLNSSVAIEDNSVQAVCIGLLVDWYPAYACYLHQHDVSENQLDNRTKCHEDDKFGQVAELRQG